MNLIEFTRSLLRCPSVTPDAAGSLDLIATELQVLGFHCERMPKGNVDNLYAKRDRGGKTLCFAGHVDVVPPGPLALWQSPPFSATCKDGILYGRGAVDMKPAISAFMDAVSRFLASHGEEEGSLAFLLTSDEEGPAQAGTRYVVEQLVARGERIDACIVGEPTSRLLVGDTVKIGRRGSLTSHLTVQGIQGHVAYPDMAKNPIGILLDLLQILRTHTLDLSDCPGFDPSRLEIVTVDVGNPASNVIPACAKATFNIRFNALHTIEALQAWLLEAIRPYPEASLSFAPAAASFCTAKSPFCDLVVRCIAAKTGLPPQLSTSGGTSDARFLAPHFPVMELGLLHACAHQVNEQVPFTDIELLRDIYLGILEDFFLVASES